MRFVPMYSVYILLISLCGLMACGEEGGEEEEEQIDEAPADIYFGADLSFVNQIIDHGGVYKDNGVTAHPYKIFKDHGANLVRLRIWHNPQWTKEAYGENGTQLYSDLADVEKSITLSKAQGLPVLLDFHYSDTWADPGNQKIPVAWREIETLSDLKDSVYNYTFKTLTRLKNKGLMPEFVQIGNETNCGMMYSDKPANFPSCNVCDGNWQTMGEVVNSGIKAVREVASATKVILHVADPKNVDWWFDNMTTKGKVTDFQMIGFSYYPLWHTTVTLDQLSNSINTFKTKYNRDIIILETAYPWTATYGDDYNNLFGSQPSIAGFPFTANGQLNMMKKITQEVIDGGGAGLIYWEPAWITSGLKDAYGTGSSWENVTFFDFAGNTNATIDFMNASYQ